MILMKMGGHYEKQEKKMKNYITVHVNYKIKAKLICSLENSRKKRTGLIHNLGKQSNRLPNHLKSKINWLPL